MECKSRRVIKKGSQGSRKRYLCLGCGRSFSVNHGRKDPIFWIPHIDGLPFRKLGDQQGISGKQAFVKAGAEINLLPWNYELTRSLCDPARFCRILVIDGKYVGVKDFREKIPLIWGNDYLTHDFPHGDLFVSESEISFSEYFHILDSVGYRPEIVVADDRQGLKQALNKVFPLSRLQLCHTHYLENIRQLLGVRTDGRYLHFFNSLQLHVFKLGVDDQTIDEGWRHVWKERTNGSRFPQEILKEIDRRREDLFSYLKIPGCPSSTNIIESYNSHLKGRLATIKGFQSFESARAWLNAYLIRRRTKKMTDCKKKFKRLNKHCSLELTIKKQAQWPETLKSLGINKVNYFDFDEIGD